MIGAWSYLKPVPEIDIHMAATDRGLSNLSVNAAEEAFLAWLRKARPGFDWRRDEEHPILRQAATEIGAYFRGALRGFGLPLDLDGTAFQMRVWAALQRIPYGKTRTYKEIALDLGAPTATRAVGGANGANPIALVVPCHRVIASGGALGGYGGGLRVKSLLLDLEGATYRRG